MLTFAWILPLIAPFTGAESAPLEPAAPVAQDEPPPPMPYWTGGLTAGGVWTDGNTNTASANGSFNAERRDEKDRWTFDAYVNYADQEDDSVGTPGATDTEINQRNFGGGVKYDYFVTEKFYYLANVSGKHDDVAELYLRYVAGAGIGYQVREDEKIKWGVETGLAYVNEDYDPDPTVPPATEDPDSRGWAGRLASNLAWTISESTSFEQNAELLPSLEDSENLIARFDNRLKVNLTENWIAQLQYVLDFDGETPPGVEEADHRVVFGLGWTFGA